MYYELIAIVIFRLCDIMIAECHQVTGVAFIRRVTFPGSEITEFLNGMIQGEPAFAKHYCHIKLIRKRKVSGIVPQELNF